MSTNVRTRRLAPVPPLVGSNTLVIKEIMKNADRDTLEVYRRVNSTWNNVASSALLKNFDLNVKFSFSCQRGIYENSSKVHPDGQRKCSLQDLTDWLNRPCSSRKTKFPCHSFSFFGGDLSSSDAVHFFESHGRNVQSLSLHLDGNSPHQQPITTAALRKLFFIDTPELQYLHLAKLPDLTWDPWQNPSNLKLESLKVLNIDGCTVKDAELIQAILKAAVNLVVTEGFQVDFLDIFSSENKLGTIKSLSFKPSSKNLQFVEKFAQLGQQKGQDLQGCTLKDLSFDLKTIVDTPHTWQRVANSLNSVLFTHRESLTSISYFHPVRFLPGLTIPKMEQVTSITFGEWDYYYMHRSTTEGKSGMFPNQPNFNLMERFPHLEKVAFCIQRPKKDSDWRLYLSEFDRFFGVRCLQVSQQVTPDYIEKLPSLFPNLRCLTLENIEDFHRVARAVFKHLPQLISLKFGAVNILTSVYKNSGLNLDSTFTGMREYQCRQLRDATTSKRNLKWLLRKNGSIENYSGIGGMKNLQHLTIEFLELSSLYRLLEEMMLFTFVTALQGFQLVPNLKVKIIARKIRDSPKRNEILMDLKAVSPFVNIKYS